MRPVLAKLIGLLIAAMAAVSTPAKAHDGGIFPAGKALRLAPTLFNDLRRLSPRRGLRKLAGPAKLTKRLLTRRLVTRRLLKSVVRPSRRAREVVAVGLRDSEVTRLVGLGFRNLGRRNVGGIGSLTRLRVPAGKSRATALAMIRRSAPKSSTSENATYRVLSRHFYNAEGETCGDRCEAFELTGWTSDAARCSVGARIGVIDTAADLSHPTLAGARIESRVMRRPDLPPSDSEHGTAVLSLLAGASGSDVVGIANSAEILHVDAFHGTGEETRADVFDLVAAIDWLVSKQVDVINLSLSGPDNPILKRAIEAAQKQGIHIVAAAGKPDRNNLAGYPARYPGVTAVGAVDSRLRASRLSLRGRHLTFAAPGVGLTVAHGKSAVRRVDGTSFATPFVSAAFAIARARGIAASDVADDLASSAQDLGPKGRDPVFGYGLIRYSSLPQC